MPSARPPHALARRTFVAAALVAPLAGCGLRLESDAPVPGPKAEPAPDTKPLEQVRAWLVEAMTAAERETIHHAQAGTAQKLHNAQLDRLDATLKGLGATTLPSVTATGTPSAPPTSSSSSTPASTPSSTPEQVPPSASPSASPTGESTSWTRAESVWAGAQAAVVLQRLSRNSRPVALAIAAASLASLRPADITVRWPSTIAMPRTDGTLLASVEAVIDALEWSAARTKLSAREEITAQLEWAYAARSLTQAGMPAQAAGKRAPWRTYSTHAQAHDVARKAALGVVSGAAKVSSSTKSAHEAAGLLSVWSGAAAVAEQLGEPLRPLPGLSA